MRLFRAAAGLLAAATAVAAPPSHVDPETLLKAINFALLGVDTKAYVWKSREDCVVVSDTTTEQYHSVEVLHLNNVDGSRVRIAPYKLTYPDGHVENYVKVELHGEDTIREYTIEGRTLDAQLLATPLTASSDWTYTRETTEFDRMVRAWK
jgi:hypothetical protein